MCPSCLNPQLSVFYEVAGVPTNSVLLLNNQEEAQQFPRGDIHLGFCAECGFITNTAFDPALTQYNARYEATQGYSPTFNAFHQRLAGDLVERYGLRDKSIIEIGCDKGDFLTMLCELGNNRGVGFDPAYVPGRHPSDIADQLTFIADFYSEEYTDYTADFVCCKMTLEHIPNVGEFVGMVRRAIGDRPDTVVFFQVPNGNYVFEQVAFWDIYYEHCSYFNEHSLSHLFRRSGFEVLSLWTDYDDQYLMIEARPAAIPEAASGSAGVEEIATDQTQVERFTRRVDQRIQAWRERIRAWRREGNKLTLWGGGSKAVAFITTLGLSLQDIEIVVDINPHKADTYLAGSGQRVVLPDYLTTYRPDVVLIMNPVYREEIRRDLERRALFPLLLTVEDMPEVVT